MVFAKKQWMPNERATMQGDRTDDSGEGEGQVGEVVREARAHGDAMDRRRGRRGRGGEAWRGVGGWRKGGIGGDGRRNDG